VVAIAIDRGGVKEIGVKDVAEGNHGLPLSFTGRGGRGGVRGKRAVKKGE
jgi:hypothetical protein